MGKSKRHIRGQKGICFTNKLKGVDLEKVIVVALDAAKDFPKTLICNYFGEIIEEPFFFTGDVPGIFYLHEKIQTAINWVQAQRCLVGIESTGHYHEDIVRSLERLGYEVTLINPYTTKEERNSALNWIKTDDVDLASIALVLISNKGCQSKLRYGIWQQLFTAVRARRSEVNNAARLKTDIRVLLDHIWKDFQGFTLLERGVPRKVSIFGDLWCQASRFFMKNYSTPESVIMLGKDKLIELAKKHHLRLSSRHINRLLEAANRAIPKSHAEIQIELLQLQFKLDLLEKIEARITELERIVENLFVQTPGVLLLSIPGIGVTSAAEFIAELGPVWNFTHARQIIKMAGTNPLLSQSGGKRTKYGKSSRQGNPALRRIVVLIGTILCQDTSRNRYFLDFSERLTKNGKGPNQRHVAVGNKFIKVAFAMLRDCRLFMQSNSPYTDYSFLVKVSNSSKKLALQSLQQIFNSKFKSQVS